MGFFGSRAKAERKDERPVAQVELPLGSGAAKPQKRPAPARTTGRTEVYAVRVRESFKGEVRRALVEVELDRQKLNSRARKVTEGEVMELMLECFKAARRNGSAAGYAVPLAEDVWRGAVELGRRMHMPPGEVIERLVVEKIAELGVLARA